MVEGAGEFYAGLIILGGVDEFEPISGRRGMNNAQEASDELVIARGNGAANFQTTEHSPDAVQLWVDLPASSQNIGKRSVNKYLRIWF